MATAVASNESVILSRVLRPERGDLPQETAHWLLGVDFDPADRARIAALYEKAREESLTETEDAELEDYGDVGRMLEMLRAKARVSLRRQPQNESRALLARQARSLREHLQRPVHLEVAAASGVIAPEVAGEETHRAHLEKKHS